MTVSTKPLAGRLAEVVQEPLTAVVRLRAERQPVLDATAFRDQLRQWLVRSEQEALALGFAPADVRLAIFAVVAFLDESVLNARVPALAEWARRPLQDELFGGHMAGEWFFQHVDQLLARPDDPFVGDVLEVYQLCLLLGFRGKYGASDGGAITSTMQRIGSRLDRLRGAPGSFAPRWQPPADRVNTTDPLVHPLTIGALVAVIVLFSVWSAYALMLRASIRSIAATPSSYMSSGR